MLKGLRGFQTAEQGLRLARTLTGQKNGSAQVARFRTFDPVDMHGLVHSGGQFAGIHGVFRMVWQCLAGLAVAGDVEVVVWDGKAIWPEPGFFFTQPGNQEAGSGAVVEAVKAAGRSARPASKNFFGEAVKTKRVLRFTTKSLYTE